MVVRSLDAVSPVEEAAHECPTWGNDAGCDVSACPGGIAALSGCIFVVGWSFQGGRSGGCVYPGGDGPPNAGCPEGCPGR